MSHPMKMYVFRNYGSAKVIVWALSEERARQWAGDLIARDEKPDLVMTEDVHHADEGGWLFDVENGCVWTKLQRPEERSD